MPLDGALMDRYALAIKNFSDTSQALKSGLSGTPSPDGSKPEKGKTTNLSSSGLKRLSAEELHERLEALAFAPRLEDAPPITTYRTTSSEHGEIFTATEEYITWLRRKVPGYGELHSVSRAIPSGDRAGSGIEF